MSDQDKQDRAQVAPEDLERLFEKQRQAMYQQVLERQREELVTIAGKARGALLHEMYPQSFPQGAVISFEEYNVVMRMTASNLSAALLSEYSRMFTSK